MITIFAIPKSFTKNPHINIIQRNAIKSWLKTQPGVEVILFGKEDGVKEVAKELGVTHIPEIQTNDFGTPLLSSAFDIVQKVAKNNYIMQISSDIIILSDVSQAIKKVAKDTFLMGGQRYDYDITTPLDFEKQEWSQELYQKAVNGKKPHGPSAVDYFVFPKGLIVDFPEFAVGRAGWDNWLIFNNRKRHIPMIDSTEYIKIVHQNHDYSHSKFAVYSKLGNQVQGPELKRTYELIGGPANKLTLRDADFILTDQGLVKPKGSRLLLYLLSHLYIWRLLLDLRRKVRALLIK